MNQTIPITILRVYNSKILCKTALKTDLRVLCSSKIRWEGHPRIQLSKLQVATEYIVHRVLATDGNCGKLVVIMYSEMHEFWGYIIFYPDFKEFKMGTK